MQPGVENVAEMKVIILLSLTNVISYNKPSYLLAVGGITDAFVVEILANEIIDGFLIGLLKLGLNAVLDAFHDVFTHPSGKCLAI